MIRRYFEEEMRYLHEAGKAFAEVHPEQARMLNIDSLTDRDPYVERLFEGFAFLTGRIRERLDDELPQYTESLFRLLHPHFLKPVPSLAVLEFTPRPGMLQNTMVLKPGTEVRSSPVGREATVCRFTTAYPVALQPFRLSSAQMDYADSVSSRATLRFQLDRGVEFDKLDLKRLRLYFHAEPVTASTAHLFFTHHVSRLILRAGEQTVRLYGQQWVEPVGLRDDEGLLPYSPHSFIGYRLLQEYFCFRPKFWFADLLGLDQLQPAGDIQSFEVEIHFDNVFPNDKAFQADTVRLHCTPIVNLFEADAEPIRVEHQAAEYRVIGETRRPQSVAVYDITGVTGIEDGSGQRFTYKPFFAFGHADGERYYVETARTGPSGRREVFVSAGGFGSAVTGMSVETFSINVRCTNGNLPREALQEGSIDQAAPGFPSVATFRNLTQPTREFQPPLEEHPELFWKLISHLAFNQMSVATKEALVGLLELYEWTGSAANKRRISGVRNVSWKPKDRPYRGAVMRGGEVIIEVQDGHFSDEGDLNLFGTVLSAFLSAYATINSFVDLVFVSMPSGKRYEWIARKGTRPPL